MLFGDADVETALRKAFREQVQPGAIGHRGGDGDDLVVMLGLFDQALRKHFGVAWRIGRRLFLLTRDDVEFCAGVAPVRRFLSGVIALALLRQGMDQDRAVGAVFDGAKNRQKLIHVVAIDRTDIGKAKLFKQRAANGHRFDHFFRPPRAFAEWRGQQRGCGFGGVLQILKRLTRIDARKIGAEGANRRRNGHLIVVQDDNQPFAKAARVVHRLERHASAHRSIADHRNAVAGVGAKFSRHRKAKRGGDRG